MLIPAAQPSFDFIAHHAAQGPCVVLASWSALGARQAHVALGVPLCSVYLSPGAVARDDAAPAGTEKHCAVGFFPGWFGMPPSGEGCAIIPTGFPMFDEALVPPLPAPLEDFLRQGPAPVIFTPGSFMRQANDFFEAGLAACARLGLRAVLLSPYRHALPQHLPANAMHFPYIALQRLAPRAAALVSHGGIGTIAQGLAAGIPQLTTPVFFDQADNAARLVALGVGDRVTPVTADTMTAKLVAVLASAPIQAACARIRAGMRDPRAQICDLVEKMGRAG
jgi:rhamnosyltransferase subunit B